MKYFILVSSLIVCLLTSCNTNNNTTKKDPLPSWNSGSVKKNIIEFVSKTADSTSSLFIPVEDRIAAFDNDGTLWSEKPFYFQLFFTAERLKELSKENPELKNEQPFKALIDGDFEALKSFGEHGLLKIVMATHGNISDDEFKALVESWMGQAEHPEKKVKFTELVYQPMLELMDYLRANNFKTFIVSGGGVDFMRPWAPSVYNIPAEQIIGSRLKKELVKLEDTIAINRLPVLSFLNDKSGKPLGIYEAIGKKPVFTVGNSDGDLEMLQWTDTQKNSFKMYIHHTDAIREWAYDSLSAVGRLKKGLEEASNKSWSVVDMKKDWKVVFPFELK